MLVSHLVVPAAWVDGSGAVAHTNDAWRALTGESLLAGARFVDGSNFVQQCAEARESDPRLIAAVRDAIAATLDGRADELTISYKSPRSPTDSEAPMLHSAYNLRFMRARSHTGAVGVIVTHRPKRPDLYGGAESESSSQRTRELEALVQQRTEELRRDIEERERAEEERKRLEQDLLQSQKLEGVGRLAGGIAHDFNNLLTIILAYGHQTLSKLELPTQARSYVTEMVAAAQRASELTRQLLTFARKQPIEPKIIDLNELVLATDGLLRPLLGPDVELVTLPAPDRCTVRVDHGQFERILVNLAANARDAMPSGGKLVIATANVTVDEALAANHVELTAGDYVRLEVTDTGAGIPAEVLPDIFDPFFTTKAVGAGTGLGLATCYGIVKQAGGHIIVASEPRKGTTFEIFLPKTEAESSRPAFVIANPRTGGNETILLIEDEPLLRSITSDVLEEEGYRVLEAESGAEAIRLAEEQTGTIDLLLTDIVMPHMSGKVAAARITELRPQTRVLYMSGYAGASLARDGRIEEGVAFLPKPFTREALLDRVRQLLDHPAPRSA